MPGTESRPEKAQHAKEKIAGVGPIKILILAWERPLYLWASLDSLYRNTRTDVDFIIVDNNSKHPLVPDVIRAFHRRGMFHEVIKSPSNDPTIVNQLLTRLAPDLGRYLAYVEADVVIGRGDRCWVKTMVDIMEQRPRMAMLGSQVDHADFIDPAWLAETLGREPDSDVLNFIKAGSPERKLKLAPGELADPFNPPGRLLMLRSAAMLDVGMARDSVLYRQLKAKGYECAITGDVIHRHLSLQNYFDYDEYDLTARNVFMNQIETRRNIKSDNG